MDEPEVYVGDSAINDNGAKKSVNPFEEDFGPVNPSDIDRILNQPGKVDVGGSMARWNFSDDEERKAYLETLYNCRALGMDEEEDFIMACGQSTLGRKGFGKGLQLQAKIGMALPTFMREQLGISEGRKKKSEREEVSRRSDFVKNTDMESNRK